MAAGKGSARSGSREAFWRRLVSGQPASGVSIRAWCERHEVSEPSFYAWRRELARRDSERRTRSHATSSTEFIKMHVPCAAASTAIQLVVSGARIEVGPGFDGETLRRLLDMLRETASC
jgi:transposase-like protein